MGIRRVAVRQPRMAAGVGMARCEPNEKNDHLRNRQFEGQVQDQVPALHLHIHVVLWDESPESPDDAAEERDENIGEYPPPDGQGK